MFVPRWLNLNRSWRGWRFIIWHTVHHTSSSPSFLPRSWAKSHLNKYKNNTQRQKDKSCFHSRTWFVTVQSLPHHPGWVKWKEIKLYPPLGLMVNALHHPTATDDWDAAQWEWPQEASTETVVINLSLITLNIFVWSHQASKNPEHVSQSVGYEEQELVETHGGGGYDACNVLFPGALPEGGASLVAASCSYQTECSSACLSEFTPGASRAIILNGGRYNPMNMCNHVLVRQRDEGREEEVNLVERFSIYHDMSMGACWPKQSRIDV